ncbi:uncharacterized protein LOC117093423 [Trachypithecus francoisi]|uniref:uncharacterized protein LOC117093423 n=1 Tax=Trachypithecus francoisi TaxID=54180 RepID=UPI00141A7AB0|nr:uncharacterized protein LOC117093423 [Trachypithecus francoisi]
MRLPAVAANWLPGVGKRVPPPGAHKGAATTCAAAAASRPSSDPRARPGLRERRGWTSGKAWRAASGKPSGLPPAPSTGEPQTTVNEERRAGETSASAQEQRPATLSTGDRWTP